MKPIERDFHSAMLSIAKQSEAAGYRPSMFLRMLSKHGGLETAKRLINSPEVSDGYTRLWQMRKLELSVEAVVHENTQWHELFTAEERKICRKRLSDYNYL